MQSLEDLNKFRVFYKLKSVYRFNSVDNRKESSAEHSWSCLVLADYFIENYYKHLDKLKVFELLLYHDVIEILVGDNPLHPNNKKEVNKEDELRAAHELSAKLPPPLDQKYLTIYKEFEEQRTIESKFAKAIDALDAIIHELDYKKDWKGWNENFLIKHKLKYFEEFKEIKERFYDLITYLKKEKYF